MSKKFKAMQFYIGEDHVLSENLQKLLFSMGYSWITLGANVIRVKAHYINTYEDGDITYGHGALTQEINIDWMRTPQKETIELNGKKYLKEDLEEALKHLKAVDE